MFWYGVLGVKLEMSSVAKFNEVWKGLVSKSSSGEERGHFYLSLTG